MPIQARTEFAAALNQIASEKGVDVNIVISAIEDAALAAYKKDLSLRGEEVPEDAANLTAQINHVTGEISILEDGKNITPPGFARIAAQTAKQVIMQKLYEAEKSAVMDEYEQKVGTVISATIQRQEGSNYYVDLGRAEGILPANEQTRDEYLHLTQRLKVYIKEIREGRRGPEVVVSRSDSNLVKGLFGLEVPEIQSGSVEIKEIAREAGGRTKLAAISSQDGVDPVGSLVGQKGVRVQAVMQELGDEKIDIVPFSEDPVRFIAAALSPAKDVVVKIENKDEKVAKVIVPDSQLSLAIGKGGQNVRLAAKLTGYKIDIEGMGDGFVKGGTEPKEAGTNEAVVEDSASQTDDSTAIPTSSEEGQAREEVEQTVEANIDAAVEEEAGNTQPEPTVEETQEAAAVAEADMAQDPEMQQSEGGDLIATEEPTDPATDAPAESMDTQGVTEDIQSDESDQKPE